MTCMVVVIFLFLRGWFSFSKSAAVISLLLLLLQLLLTGPRTVYDPESLSVLTELLHIRVLVRSSSLSL